MLAVGKWWGRETCPVAHNETTYDLPNYESTVRHRIHKNKYIIHWHYIHFKTETEK
jgi:hypothetical protein